jgi:hypothetical protein
MTLVVNQQMGENWAMYQGDCVELIQGIPDASIHYQIYSLPFESLYTYSATERDMGNCRSSEEFWQHYRFLIAEQMRVQMAGRLISIHCMNLPVSKERSGYIGLRDFRGEIIRAYEAAGFIYHSEAVIWKDPVTAMQRTKALGLLHKQLVKDSCMSRQGIPDYLVTVRKPGENPSRVTGPLNRYAGDGFIVRRDDTVKSPLDAYSDQVVAGSGATRTSIDIWQRYASPVWMDINPSDTLQRESAREQADERHIAPLQLQVIERGIQLWSNPGDLVYSPFAGIGSEGYRAVQMGRRFLGHELKESYFKQACANLRNAEATMEQTTLFSGVV